MADVQFFGIGANGFPDPTVQILSGDQISTAEVQLEGIVAAPEAALDITREILTPSEVVPLETDVDFFPNEPPLPPTSENPNDNEILFIVTVVADASNITVNMVPAPIPRADGMVTQPPPTPNDIRLFSGPNVPSGLAGKIALFIQPTGTSNPALIQGVTELIRTINPPAGLAITFDSPLSVLPTMGDRFTVKSVDRTLRRTPLVEVILD